MSQADVKDIIQDAIRYDDVPPNAEYNPYDHGAEVARKLDDESVSLLVFESLRTLPGGLAQSFLNGVLDVHPIVVLKDTLLRALPHGREIGTATAVVRLLLDRCGVKCADVVSWLASAIQATTDAHAQDLYAFAIWLMRGKDDGAESNAGARMDAMFVDDMVFRSILADVPLGSLTQYARETLEKCLR